MGQEGSNPPVTILRQVQATSTIVKTLPSVYLRIVSLRSVSKNMDSDNYKTGDFHEFLLRSA